MSNHSLQQNSFLQCYICMQRVQKPRMCPYCSKLACFECLRTWQEDRKGECAHCRSPVEFNNFANCQRFIQDVLGVFKKMDKSQRPKDQCDIHHLDMVYYCDDCQMPICSDCGLFDSKHKTHQIMRLSKICEKNKSRIVNNLAKFDQKIEEYKKNGNAMKIQLQKLLILMQQKKGYLEAYFGGILQKLDLEYKQKQSLILNKFQSNEQEVELLQRLKQKIVQDLQNYTPKQIITKCEQIVKVIDQLYNKPVQALQLDDHFSTIKQLVPEYEVFQYKLCNFAQLDEKVVYSDSFNINGLEWRLKIYPQGNGLAKNKCLSVFLELAKGYETDFKYEYKIELINQEHLQASISREYSSKFDLGECWGYNQFVPLQILTSGFLIKDTLIFRFFVRNVTYKELSINQRKYNQILELKLKNNQRKSLGKIDLGIEKIKSKENNEIHNEYNLNHLMEMLD